MPGRRISDEDYAGLIGTMESGAVGSHNWEVGKAKLTLATFERQTDASNELVRATARLVKATQVLGWYTLALVLATVVLVVATIVTATSKP